MPDVKSPAELRFEREMYDAHISELLDPSEWHTEPSWRPARKPRKPRTPSIRARIAAAEKAGKTVTSVTLPDGTVLQFGAAGTGRGEQSVARRSQGDEAMKLPEICASFGSIAMVARIAISAAADFRACACPACPGRRPSWQHTRRRWLGRAPPSVRAASSRAV